MRIAIYGPTKNQIKIQVKIHFAMHFYFFAKAPVYYEKKNLNSKLCFIYTNLFLILSIKLIIRKNFTLPQMGEKNILTIQGDNIYSVRIIDKLFTMFPYPN